MSRRFQASLIMVAVLLSAGTVSGQGLTGDYFPNVTLKDAPVLTRIENVNFNWGGNSPGDPVGVDVFSVRWTGSLMPPESGDYTFATRSDDGVRLWVGGDQVINNWTDHSATLNRSVEFRLEAGVPVSIQLEYYESGGDAVIELYWAGPGFEEQIIPVEFLSPTVLTNLQARRPDPADGALDFDPQVPLLQWMVGETAKYHNVYLGLSPVLTDADRVATRSPLAQTMYYHILPMTPGTTYYWRVDEIEKDLVTVHTGKVWSFTVQAATAYHPLPADATTDALVAPVLTWLPGTDTLSHRLYFSDSLDAVTEGAAEADKGEFALANASFTPDVLDAMTTYYWRVDETLSDGTVVTGPVWSFTTCLPIEDFEDYTDVEPDRIFDVWLDGYLDDTNGSIIGYLDSVSGTFNETTIVHGGLQSMPLDFNNIDAFYSEVEREFAGTQDLTVGEANTLVIYLRGKLLNPPTQLYVSLEDSSKHLATVKHPDPEITKSLKWSSWKIPLSDFGNVSPARVKKIYIGVGDKTASVKGGAGMIFIDDICASKEPPSPEPNN